MQSELDTWINQWNTQNNMVLNPKKCKEMVVRCRRHVEHSPPALTIDNKTLERADSHKVLVVILQSNLKWDPPISKIVGKASLNGGSTPSDLLRIYSSLIRSSLSIAVRYGIPPSLSTCLMESRGYSSGFYALHTRYFGTAGHF